MNKKTLWAIPLCLLLALPSVADYLCITENAAGFRTEKPGEWTSRAFNVTDKIILKYIEGGSYSLDDHGSTFSPPETACVAYSTSIVCRNFVYPYFTLDTVNHRFIALIEGAYIKPFVYDPSDKLQKATRDYLGDDAAILGGVCSKL